MMLLIDVTDENDRYTITRYLLKKDALQKARELVDKEGLKIDVFDTMNRFKTIEVR